MEKWKLILIIVLVLCYILLIIINELRKFNSFWYYKFLEKTFGNWKKKIEVSVDDIKFYLLMFSDNSSLSCQKIITDGLRKYKNINFEIELLIENHMDSSLELFTNMIKEIVIYAKSDEINHYDVFEDMDSLKDTKFDGCILTSWHVSTENKIAKISINRKQNVRLFKIVPLYKEEIAFCMENNYRSLIKSFLGYDALGVIDIGRFNYKDKKITLDDILLRKDSNLIYELVEKIVCDKYKDNKKMSLEEKNLAYIFMFMKEVNTLEIRSYFSKEVGKDCHKMIEAFKEVTRPRVYAFMYEVYNFLGGKKIPLDLNKRKKYLDKLSNEKVNESMIELDDRFNDLRNVIYDDLIKYIRNNKDKIKE